MIDRTTHKPVLDAWQHRMLDVIEPSTEGHTLVVTRGHSLPLEQLALIEKYGRQNGLLDGAHFPEFVSGDLTSMTALADGKMAYLWQRLWSELLHLFSTTSGRAGAKINPPFSAICLYDYIVNGVNKKDHLIGPSSHIKDVPTNYDIATGRFTTCPIDFSQKIDGTPDITRVASIMTLAQTASRERNRNRLPEDSGPEIRTVTTEPANGCVHIDVTGKTARAMMINKKEEQT